MRTFTHFSRFHSFQAAPSTIAPRTSHSVAKELLSRLLTFPHPK
jgi:hypothetical protein